MIIFDDNNNINIYKVYTDSVYNICFECKQLEK